MASLKKQPKGRKIIISAVILALVLAAIGFGYVYWNQKNKAATASTTTTTYTAQVRRGSIILSASGAGTLTAGKQSNLSFPVSGVLGEVEVKVGDKVEEGQILAQLKDLSSLEASLASAELALSTAQKALEDLKNNSTVNLANAQLAAATANKAYTDAKSSVVDANTARCNSDSINAYYADYMKAQAYLESLGDWGANYDFYLSTVQPAQNAAANAYAKYKYCAGYTAYEIDSSQAEYSLTDAEMKDAQATLDALKENNGIDPLALAQAENDLANAQANYDKARNNLDGATLKAPFAGTVLVVNGEAGDDVGTSAFISIIDLYHPKVSFSMDETDVDKVAVGNEGDVVFDAMPDITFTGKVIQVSPALTSSNGISVLTGIIQLVLTEKDNTDLFLEGLNASVEIVGGKSENTLLVPIEALRDLGDGTYAVFVVGSDGQPKLTIVEVGLMDATSAEIKSGVNQVDVVTTGTMETK